MRDLGARLFAPRTHGTGTQRLQAVELSLQAVPRPQGLRSACR